MLSKTPSTAPAMKTAFTGGRSIKLAPGVHCPHCGREMQASDVEIVGTDAVLICQGCHRDIVVIGGAP